MIDSVTDTRAELPLPPSSRESLIERHLPLAKRLARRYRRAPGHLEDLEQVAALALVKAADRFDPARGTAFSTFAVPTIVGEIKRYFRDSSWTVHVPRDLKERALRVEAEAQRLTTRLGRTPSVGDLGASLRMPVEEVAEARNAFAGFQAASLDAPVEPGSEEDGGQTRADFLGTTDQGYELVEDRAAVESALPVLSEQYRLALHLRFRDDMSQREIGECIGVSQIQVSRILRRSLDTPRAVA